MSGEGDVSTLTRGHLKRVIEYSALLCEADLSLGQLASHLLSVLVLTLVFQPASFAENIRVRQAEGPIHTFLGMTTLDGSTIADGELIEFVKGAGEVLRSL